jgi:glutathione S-transferase
MKLYFAPPSPFARKARIALRELNLAGLIEEIPVNPFEVPAGLVAANPLSKVPTLILDDGTSLYDSHVICEYLGALGARPLVPVAGPARWAVLRRHALADGALEAAFNIACEINRRPEHERSPAWLRRWCEAIERSLEVLNGEIGSFGNDVTLAHIGAASMLSYLDLRLAMLVDWRGRFAELVRWHDDFAERPSMQETRLRA